MVRQLPLTPLLKNRLAPSTTIVWVCGINIEPAVRIDSKLAAEASDG